MRCRVSKPRNALQAAHAAFPDQHTRASKFWPAAGRVDNA